MDGEKAPEAPQSTQQFRSANRHSLAAGALKNLDLQAELANDSPMAQTVAGAPPKVGTLRNAKFMAQLAGMISGTPPAIGATDAGAAGGEQMSISLRNVTTSEPKTSTDKPLEKLAFERPKQKKRLPAKLKRAKEAQTLRARISRRDVSHDDAEEVKRITSLILPVQSISNAAQASAEETTSSESSNDAESSADGKTDGLEPTEVPVSPRTAAAATVTPRRRGFAVSVAKPLADPDTFSAEITSLLHESVLKISTKLNSAQIQELCRFIDRRDFKSFVVVEPPSGDEIVLLLQRILNKNAPIEFLTISKCGYKQSIICDIVGAIISTSTTLKAVDLSHNLFGDSVLLKAAVGLRFNSSVTTLDLRHCAIRGTQSSSSHLTASLSPLFARRPSCKILIEETQTLGVRLQSRLSYLGSAHEINLPKRRYITQMIVSSSEVVDSIRITFSDGTGKMLGSPSNGEPSEPIVLLDTEYIVRVTTSTGKSAGKQVLFSISLHTSLGNTFGPFGTVRDAEEEYNDPPSRTGTYGLVDIGGEAVQWRRLFSDECVGAAMSFVWEEF